MKGTAPAPNANAAIDEFDPTSSVVTTPRGFAGMVFGSFFAAFVGVMILLRVALSLYRLLRGGDSVPAIAGGREGLSVERKKEIDDLRLAAIRRHLDKLNVTVTLNEDDGNENDTPTQSVLKNVNATIIEKKYEMDTNMYDEESQAVDEKHAQNHDVNLQLQQQQHMITSNDENGNETAITPISIECAICQEEYTQSSSSTEQKICQSSQNSKCIHVFHQECIEHWLVSLGWMKLKEREVLQSTGHGEVKYEKFIRDESKLLDYDLECPCCRQPFIVIDREEVV